MELNFTEIDDLDMNIQQPLKYFELPPSTPEINTKINKLTKVNKKSNKPNKPNQKIIPETNLLVQEELIKVQKNINQREKEMPKPVLKKPAISYDDILKNMNLALINGKLEFAQQPSKKVHFQEEFEHETYGKQLTREELIKQKIIDYANYRNEIIRASKVKSTRLQFTNNNNPSIYTRTQQPGLNSLFMLKK